VVVVLVNSIMAQVSYFWHTGGATPWMQSFTIFPLAVPFRYCIKSTPLPPPNLSFMQVRATCY